ncbi:MAG: hypothetical protein IPK80_27480 [Nannocystis sp.]|nr:hypothetical protein [Nannocystis sp.]
MVRSLAFEIGLASPEFGARLCERLGEVLALSLERFDLLKGAALGLLALGFVIFEVGARLCE